MQANLDITNMIAEFVATTTFEDMPDEVVEVTKRCFLDGLASIYAGSSEPCAQIARKYLSQVGGSQEANTLGEGTLKVPIHMAAFANGVAGHALDFDDTALSLEKDRSVLIHPTMPPLSACLAVGEYVEANGRELLTAFVLGFEIEVKIAEAINPEHFTGGRGFHSSGTIGVFGSVVAASRLLKLTEEQTRNAIAIAATMSAGLGVNHGTMSKPVNMGRSSETGVTAARLASLGFDGPANSLEGGRGFFEAFGGGYDPTKISGRLGSPWACLNPGTSVKPYPSGVVGHPGMDTMRRMVEKHDIKPEEVASVTVRTGENVIFPGPLRIELATSALEAKFCVPFQMSAIILNRKAGLEEFSDAFVQSTLCQEMQKRVTAVLEPEIVALGKDKVIYEIDLVTTDGRSFTERSDDLYRGGPRNPLTWDELVAKFSDCSRALFGEEQRDAIVVSVRNLDQATGVFPLRNL